MTSDGNENVELKIISDSYFCSLHVSEYVSYTKSVHCLEMIQALTLTVNVDYIRFLFFLGLQRNPVLGTGILELLPTGH